MTAASTARRTGASDVGPRLIPLGYLFYFIGTGVRVFKNHPTLPSGTGNGQAAGLALCVLCGEAHAAGLAGLVMAAFFAASMSAISFEHEATRRCAWKTLQSDSGDATRATRTTCWWQAHGAALGVCTVAMGFVFMHIASRRSCGAKSWPSPPAHPRPHGARLPAVAGELARGAGGFVAAYVCLFLMMFFLRITPSVALVYPLPKDSGVNFLLWPVIGNLVCFGLRWCWTGSSRTICETTPSSPGIRLSAPNEKPVNRAQM